MIVRKKEKKKEFSPFSSMFSSRPKTKRRRPRRRAKTLAFCIISIITDDICLKHGVSVHYTKSNPYLQGRQFKMHFFPELCPFFDLTILSSIKHPTAECWHPHAVLLLTLFQTTKSKSLQTTISNVIKVVEGSTNG